MSACFAHRFAGFLLCCGALPSLAGCRTARPVIDRSEPISARGTISGNVRGPEGTAPVAGRKVEAVDVQTGARHAVETNSTGGYTFLLPPGTYRIEVTLLPGEAVAKQPKPVELKSGDIDTGIDVVLGGAAVVKPPGPGAGGTA